MAYKSLRDVPIALEFVPHAVISGMRGRELYGGPNDETGGPGNGEMVETVTGTTNTTFATYSR